MMRVILLVGLVLGSANVGAQGRADNPDTAFHAVSYVEVRPASTAAAVAALRQYRDATRGRDGSQRFDLFEQVGRPGHLAIVETWRDRQNFDTRGAAARAQLLAALQPVRVSDFDQRPYKTLAVAPARNPSSSTGRAVVVVTHVDTTPSPQVAPMLVRLAAAGRQEPGNLRFDVLQHAMRENHFTVIEVWQSQRALDAHAAAAATRRYRDELQPLTGSPLDERVYTSLE